MQRPQSTADRTFRVIDLQNDVEDVMRSQRPVDFAPPVARAPTIPMPNYVEHRDGVNQVGRLSAEAVVREYEAAAKEIEAMGAEMQDAAAKCEAMTAGVHAMIAEIKETAERYRDEGKRIFLQIEDCALMTTEVRTTCDALKRKIAGPSS